MDYAIIWIFLACALVFLGLSLNKKMSVVKKAQKASQEVYQQKREEYQTLTSVQFDELPVSELAHAVLFRIMAKEDKMFESDMLDDVELFDLLSVGERCIYAIYQLELSLEGGRGSVHTFFINEAYKPYIPYIDQTFRAIHCFGIADLMSAAARLAQIIDEDLDDEENDIEGDYASYNFADYTSELLALLKSSGVVEKSGKYIKDNKELFIDEEETYDEEGTNENEEGISE